MAVKTFEQDIEDATLCLLKLAKETCWNNISDNCVFIISEIKEKGEMDFFEQRIERRKRNNKKNPKTLKTVTEELKNIYADLYDLNFYVYKAQKNRTIIEIRYYLKSSLPQDTIEKIKDIEPMFHCKIGIPPYCKNKINKYDINWELGGLRHEWKMFWWKNKFKKQIEKRK